MHIRRRDLAEQMIELRGLRGKNISVIKHMLGIELLPFAGARCKLVQLADLPGQPLTFALKAVLCFARVIQCFPGEPPLLPEA